MFYFRMPKPSGPAPGPPNASIFVKNLPYEAKEGDLKDLFSKFGRLRDVYIPLDFHTKVRHPVDMIYIIRMVQGRPGGVFNKNCALLQ